MLLISQEMRISKPWYTRISFIPGVDSFWTDTWEENGFFIFIDITIRSEREDSPIDVFTIVLEEDHPIHAKNKTSKANK